MGIVQMNGNGPVSNGLAELNHHMRDDHKQIRDGVTGEGQGLSEEDESRINEDGEDVNNGWVDEVQAQAQTMAALQGQQSQPERPLVCWERFLPLRSLKVLLVESDDSTRRVVCALLRNCGYEERQPFCADIFYSFTRLLHLCSYTIFDPWTWWFG
ncbi:hypothetical protein CICLE_v10033433mg [Citrus x clementina]|uniref:Response regulatory domain-containing protein n=1 Tax=Citrus clementina TaxID=85681 RepID=V4TI64_CITCL|nr:hypothetical protein CICLE_v10033433mg [Citrus x clementina]